MSQFYHQFRAWFTGSSSDSTSAFSETDISNNRGVELNGSGQPRGEDIESGQHQQPPLLQNSQGSTGQSPLAAGMDRIPRELPWTLTQRQEILLQSLINLTATGIIINLFYIRRATEPISMNPSLVIGSISAFISLLFGFGHLLHIVSKLVMSRGNLPLSWSKHLLSFSIMSLIFTVVSLIASFLPKTYYYMPAVLVPTVLVISMSFFGHVPQKDVDSRGDPNKADRKRSFQLAVNMTTISMTGALCALVGYHKSSSERADHVYVKVAIYFMLSASLTGLVTLLLNRMLGSWKDWKKTAVANVIMLGLLVPVVLTVATPILGGAVAAATALPIAVALFTWYIMEYHLLCDDGGQIEDELKPLYAVALTTLSISFGAVMTIFSGFLDDESKGENLWVFTFSVVSCFIASVSVILLTFRTPNKASIGEAAKALGYLTLVLLVLGVLALVSYVSS